jgi:hypothetical protein
VTIPENAAEIYRYEPDMFRTLILARNKRELELMEEAAAASPGITLEPLPTEDMDHKEAAARAFGPLTEAVNRCIKRNRENLTPYPFEKRSELNPPKHIAEARTILERDGVVVMLTADATSGKPAGTTLFNEKYQELLNLALTTPQNLSEKGSSLQEEPAI